MPGDEKAGPDKTEKIDPAVSDEADVHSSEIPLEASHQDSTHRGPTQEPAQDTHGSPDSDSENDAHASGTGPDAAQSGGVADQAIADVLEFGDERMQPEETVAADLESDDPAALKASLAAESVRADGNWERVLRMQADMENQRKRLQKDVENARKYALEAVVNDLLPVRDSLEMGILAAREADADPEKIVEGTDLTLKMLSQAFEKYNIIEINPIGEKFDPEFHQAMSMQEIEGKEPNVVTSVLQKGYTLNDRLIRPALVMVSK